MRTRTLILALGAMLGLCLGSNARADLTLTIAADNGGQIIFTGNGTGATFNFSPSSDNFSVQTSNGGVGDSVGLLGEISSVAGFSFVNTGNPSAVTGSGTLTIVSGSGDLTANVTGDTIGTSGTSGNVNVNGTINLTNVVYSGTNSDLKQLKTEAGYSGGIAVIGFTFIPGKTLADLSVNKSIHSAAFSGTIHTASTPEPSGLVLAGLGALGMIGYDVRRRKALRA